MRVRAPGAAFVAVALTVLGACGDGGEGVAAPATGGEASGDRPVVDFEIVAVGAADEGIDGVQSFRIESNEHTRADVRYSVTPPPGGPHDQRWASCGFHDEVVPEENLVHDLEHGAVWLAFSPDLPAADLEALRELTGANPKVVAAPYEGLADGEAVVASAWARQLRLGSVSDPRLAEFVARYQDGSQAPEAGVTCR